MESSCVTKYNRLSYTLGSVSVHPAQILFEKKRKNYLTILMPKQIYSGGYGDLYLLSI